MFENSGETRVITESMGVRTVDEARGESGEKRREALEVNVQTLRSAGLLALNT